MDIDRFNDRPGGQSQPPAGDIPPSAAEPPARSVVCAGCGAENRPNRLFCASCGAYLRGDEDTWEDLPPPGWPASPDAPSPTAATTSAEPPPWLAGQGGPAMAAPQPLTGSRTRDVSPSRHMVVPAMSAGPQPAGPGTWAVHSSPGGPAWGPSPAPPTDEPGRRARRSHVLGILLVLLLLVVVAAVYVSARYVYEQAASEPSTDTATATSTTPTTDAGAAASSTTSSDTTTSTTSSTSTDGDGTIVTPSGVHASSSLGSEGGNTYSPRNLVDGEITTAWSEGADGVGEGEWIQLDFDPPLTLTALEIANGYQKDRRRFEGNPRVLELRLKYSDGTAQNVRLYDDRGWQFITPQSVRTSSLRLTIVSVYPGETWEDTSLSEVRIFGRE